MWPKCYIELATLVASIDNDNMEPTFCRRIFSARKMSFWFTRKLGLFYFHILVIASGFQFQKKNKVSHAILRYSLSKLLSACKCANFLLNKTLQTIAAANPACQIRHPICGRQLQPKDKEVFSDWKSVWQRERKNRKNVWLSYFYCTVIPKIGKKGKPNELCRSTRCRTPRNGICHYVATSRSGAREWVILVALDSRQKTSMKLCFGNENLHFISISQLSGDNHLFAFGYIFFIASNFIIARLRG